MSLTQTILVTGSSGFIGSHLVTHLLSQGFKVRALDVVNSSYDGPHTSSLQLLSGDLRDHSFLEDAIRGMDWIFHLGAQSSVARSLSHPQETIEINQGATASLIEFALAAKVKGVIFSSTSAVYGRPAHLPNQETDATTPISAYGISKLAAEQLFKNAATAANRFSVVGLRYFNIYGPGQKSSSGAVVPRFLEASLNGTEIVINGDGNQTRDFVYVDDVILANNLALQYMQKKKSGFDIFNVASGNPISVLQLKDTVEKVTSTQLKVQFRPALNGEIVHSYASCERAEKVLGFKSKISLPEGLYQVKCALSSAAKKVLKNSETA